MGSLRIKSQNHILMAELKEELAKIRKRDEELNFRGTRTEEYLDACVQQKAKDARKLFDEIMKLEVPRLREEHVTKIVDILPKTVEELKVVLSPYTITVSAENQKKISETIIKSL